MNNLIRGKFTQIPNDLINDETIHPVARFLFVYLCSKPDDWKFYNFTLCKGLNCSEDTLRKYMNELVRTGWITKAQKKKTGGEWDGNDITLNDSPSPNFSGTVKTPSPNFTETVNDGTGKSPGHSNTKPVTNTELFSNTDLVPLPNQVIDYLNLKKGGSRGFEKTTTNLSPIKTRLKEKFTVEDMKKVIDAAVIKWLHDPKMKSYIRPETLFGGKFNAYLIESEDVINNANNPQQNGSSKQSTVDKSIYQFSLDRAIEAGFGSAE